MLKTPNSFKNKMKKYGKQLNMLLKFGKKTIIDKKYIKSAEPSVNGEMFTSVMRQMVLEIEKYAVETGENLMTIKEVHESKINSLNKTPVKNLVYKEIREDILLASTIDVQLGVRISEFEDYEYIDYGEYVVYDKEDVVDKNSMKLYLFDHLIDTHIKYDDDPLQLDFKSGKITVLKLLQAICDKFGFILKTTDFANANKVINEDKYAGLDYTYRDILDEISAVAGGFIKIFNKDLYVAYPEETGEVIDENDLEKLTIGKKIGAFNSLVLGRSPQEDNIYYPSNMKAEDRVSMRIDNNQIMDKNREDFIINIFNKINGLEYYVFEFTSFGFGYFEFGDIVTLKNLKKENFKTILFNVIENIDSGIKGKSYTEETNYSETKYEYATGIEKRLRNTEIICDKQEGKITQLVQETSENSEKLSKHEQTINSITDTISSVETKVETVEEKADTAQSTANSAQQTAENAQNSADKAQQTADGAVTKIETTTEKLTKVEETIDGITQTVSETITKVETVESKAEQAQSTANTANTNAQNAQNTADNVSKEIVTTNKKVSELKQTVDGFNQTVSNIETKVEKVESKADNAQSTADEATTKANNAQSTADTANTNAQNAQKSADNANKEIVTTNEKVSSLEQTVDGFNQTVSNIEIKVETVETKADNAQSVADSANDKADTAQQTANSATTKAENAQSTADTANTNAQNAQSTAEQANVNAQNAQNTADEANANAQNAQNTADEAVTQITTTNTRVSELEQTVDGFKQSVSAVEEKVVTVETKVDNAQASANKANEKIDGLQVGSRNLALNTKKFFDGNFSGGTGGATWSSGTRTIVEDNSVPSGYALKVNYYTESKTVKDVNNMTVKDLNEIVVKNLSRDYDNYAGGYMSASNLVGGLEKLIKGETYTASFWIKASQETQLLMENVVEGQTIIDKNSDGVINTQWQRIVVVFKWTDTSKFKGCFYIKSPANTTIWLSSYMLEKGTIPTDWTPAPEDIENTLATDYYTKTETQSQITQTADEIKSTVSETISEAKQEAIDSANSSTDSKLKNYSTISDMNSAITQKANSIIQEVNGNIASAEKNLNAKLELKLDTKKLISEINASADKISLKAGRLVITSGNFKLDEKGNITATSGQIGGFTLGTTNFTGALNGIYNYDKYDAEKVLAHYFYESIVLPTSVKNILDVTGDGNLNIGDAACIADIIDGTRTNTKTVKGTFKIDSKDPKNCISILSGSSVIASLGLGGINTVNVTTNSLLCGEAKSDLSGFDGTMISKKGITTNNISLVGFKGLPVISENSTYNYFGQASGGKDTALRGTSVRIYSHSSGAVYLGISGSTAVTSDETQKDIYEIDDKYIHFFDKLKPISYIYKNKGHRNHLGFGARQVEKSLLDAGLTTEQFAGIIKSKEVTISADEMGTDEDVFFEELYSLRYEEFIALNTMKIQKQDEIIQKLIQRVEKLESEMS